MQKDSWFYMYLYWYLIDLEFGFVLSIWLSKTKWAFLRHSVYSQAHKKVLVEGISHLIKLSLFLVVFLRSKSDRIAHRGVNPLVDREQKLCCCQKSPHSQLQVWGWNTLACQMSTSSWTSPNQLKFNTVCKNMVLNATAPYSTHMLRIKILRFVNVPYLFIF